MNITSQNNRTILSTLDRNYANLSQTQNKAKSQTVSVKEEITDTTIVRQEQSNDMQAHFGHISQLLVTGDAIRVPDIRKLTDKLKEDFSNINVVSGENEIATSSSNTVGENSSMSSEELMDSFAEVYSKNYEKYLAVFTRN